MSRNRSFEYVVGPRTDHLDERWAALWGDADSHAGLMCCRDHSGGASFPEGVSVWLFCHKAKARRIAQRLDAYFGQPGLLRDEFEALAAIEADS